MIKIIIVSFDQDKMIFKINYLLASLKNKNGATKKKQNKTFTSKKRILNNAKNCLIKEKQLSAFKSKGIIPRNLKSEPDFEELELEFEEFKLEFEKSTAEKTKLKRHRYNKIIRDEKNKHGIVSKTL